MDFGESFGVFAVGMAVGGWVTGILESWKAGKLKSDLYMIGSDCLMRSRGNFRLFRTRHSVLDTAIVTGSNCIEIVRIKRNRANVPFRASSRPPWGS